MYVTPNLRLTTWESTDNYSKDELAANWQKIDRHDHTGGDYGKQITTGAIKDGAITSSKIAAGVIPILTLNAGQVLETHLANNSVSTAKIQDGAVTLSKLAANLVLPIGSITAWPTATAPTGYLMCDGTLYNTGDYTALFGLLGYTYGGSAAQFGVPDLRGRALIGAGGAIGLGGTEGNATAGSRGPNHVHGTSQVLFVNPIASDPTTGDLYAIRGDQTAQWYGAGNTSNIGPVTVTSERTAALAHTAVSKSLNKYAQKPYGNTDSNGPAYAALNYIIKAL